MAYATTAEIESDFKDAAFTTSTTVKAADVTQFIVESDSLIDAYVGTVYAVPVSSGSGLQLLKLLSRSLVTARIKRIMEVKQEKNSSPDQNIVGVLLSPSKVMEILKDIQKKNIALAGAVLLTSGGGFSSHNNTHDIAPVMKKEDRQW